MSRELDRRIAEGIFGKHVLVGKSNTMSCDCKKDHVIEARPYSTSISDAWLVVEKMKERLWLITLKCFDTSSPIIAGPLKWTVFFENIPSNPLKEFREERISPIVYSDNVSEAICLAALAALAESTSLPAEKLIELLRESPVKA